AVGLIRSWLVTPRRRGATCLMGLFWESPLGRHPWRWGSSPPSPVLLLPPMRFMAMASVSWASLLIEPYDMAPVLKRFMIASTGSTSSRGIGLAANFRSKRPRSVHNRRDWLLTSSLYSLNTF